MLKTIFILYKRKFSIHFIELCVLRIKNRCDMFSKQESVKDRSSLKMFKSFELFKSFANEKKVKINKLITKSYRATRTTKYCDNLIINKSIKIYYREILNSRSITSRTIKTQIKKLLYFFVRID